MHILKNEIDTMAFAEFIAESSTIGNCYALHGDLGVGKSTFVRYVIKHFDPTIDNIPSPTFSIVQYYGSCKVLHADCYRLEKADDIYNIDLLELIPSCISFIEWPEVIQELLPSNTKHIYFTYCDQGRVAKLV